MGRDVFWQRLRPVDLLARRVCGAAGLAYRPAIIGRGSHRPSHSRALVHQRYVYWLSTGRAARWLGCYPGHFLAIFSLRLAQQPVDPAFAFLADRCCLLRWREHFRARVNGGRHLAVGRGVLCRCPQLGDRVGRSAALVPFSLGFVLVGAWWGLCQLVIFAYPIAKYY